MKMVVDAGNRGVPLEAVYHVMNRHLSHRTTKERTLIIQKSIDYILNMRMALKTVDHDSTSRLVWFLKQLTDEESERLRELPAIKQALLKMLYGCDDGFQPGAMKTDDVLKELRSLGFDADRVPHVQGITDEALVPDGDSTLWWTYIVPQYELSEEFKALEETSDKKAREHEIRMMESDDESEY